MFYWKIGMAIFFALLSYVDYDQTPFGCFVSGMCFIVAFQDFAGAVALFLLERRNKDCVKKE